MTSTQFPTVSDVEQARVGTLLRWSMALGEPQNASQARAVGRIAERLHEAHQITPATFAGTYRGW